MGSELILYSFASGESHHMCSNNTGTKEWSEVKTGGMADIHGVVAVYSSSHGSCMVREVSEEMEWDG